MNKYYTYILIFFLIVSCSSIKKTSPKNIFKHGLYKHEISILLPNKKMITLIGYNEHSDKSFKLVGLSSFGTTVISYNQSKDKSHLYYDKNIIKLTQFQMNIVLSSISDLYKLNTDICEANICTHSIFGKNIYIITDDSKNVLQIKTKYKNYIIDIKVTSYEKT